MLRNVVLAIATALLALAIAAGPACGWQTLPGVIVMGLIVAGLLFERRVYKANHPERPGPGWTRTAERFADPTTGENVVVYFNPRTGERRYVAE